MALSLRASNINCPFLPHFKGFAVPPYDRQLRPHGAIWLFVAENTLSLPLVCDALNELPVIPPNVLSPSPRTHHPIPELEEQLQDFFSTQISHSPVDRKGFSIHNGASGAIDVLAFSLCDPDEAVILTAPGYSSLTRDVGALSFVQPVLAHFPDHNPVLNVETLDAALKSSRKRIRFALILSPDNPSGLIWSPKLISQLASWAEQNQIHIVFDEAYALCVHDPTAVFTSVIDVFEGKLPSHVHVVWTTSKDFGTGGIRFGVLYTQNKELQKCASVLSSAAPVSFISQWSFANLLSRKMWLNGYVQENSRRLLCAFERVASVLNSLDIPYCKPQAGFFVWIDLRKWLKTPTYESEMQLWETLKDGGIILTPGNGCYGGSPGFFRFCFASVDNDTLTVGLQRFVKVLGGHSA
ncbi:unnamed protein product [Agarophyton chilense]